MVSPSDGLERSLAIRADATPLMGKFFFSVNSISATPSVVLTVNPFSLGPRATALANVFARYRFKFINFKFFFSGFSGGSIGAIGVLDDFTGEGDAPTSVGGVLELRCSGTNLVATTVPTEILWKPPTQDWKFCTVGATGSDQRLVQPATVYAASNGSSSTVCEVLFSMVFKGAVDTGAT